MTHLSPQSIVRYTGSSIEQTRWGNNSDPTDKLIVGKYYKVIAVEPHTWHTKLVLQGVEGKFNSVCFVDAQEDYERNIRTV